jgi:glycosyltransferase involved in cell wall biosynthesis
MTTISFVVPTKNAERTIEACVRSLRSQHRAVDVNVEVVLVDNHSTDRTVELAGPYVDRIEIAGPERCAQRNLGARVSTGEVLVFVDADMVMEPGLALEAAALVANGESDYLVIPELAFGESFFAECRSLEKRLYLGDASVEAGRVVRRDHFEAVGGWDETLTAGEDWDLSDRLRSHGAVTGRTVSRVWHDEGVVRLGAQFHKKRYYGAWVADFVRRGGGRGHLARTSLISQPKLLLASPRLSAGLATLKLVEAAGLASGMAQGWVTHRRTAVTAGLA